LAYYYAQKQLNVFHFSFPDVFHCQDSSFVFSGNSADTESYEGKLANYWTNFIKNDDPNGYKVVKWPLYSHQNISIILLVEQDLLQILM